MLHRREVALAGIALLFACGESSGNPTTPAAGSIAELAAIAAGGRFTCGLDSSGAAYCWGSNGAGTLGTGSRTGPVECGSLACSPTPVGVSGGLAFSVLRSGVGWSCGLTYGGAAYCWGTNSLGQLGTGSVAGPEVCDAALALGCSSTPVGVAGGLVFSALELGKHGHTCALTRAGAAYCWGLNYSGQLGTGSTIGPEWCGGGRDLSCSTTPVAVSGALSFRVLTLGGAHTCGLTSTGAAYCWGFNDHGQLGDGSLIASSIPVRVAGDLSFDAIAAGGGWTCGITAGGVAYCWGANGWGQLGTGSTNGPTVCNADGACSQRPTAVSGTLSFHALAAGAGHTCGITSGGLAYCWGANVWGQLGNSQFGPYNAAPTPVAGGLRFRAVAPGGDHTCALTVASQAWCWGLNAAGELGAGSVDYYEGKRTPVPVSGLP